ncbi:MAG: hypothetical protein KJ569_08105 [Candidatus Omnitrophica bacterium]|nr:hypothetical protein [Candidatus Omnitrophota bacterium]
MHDFYFNPNSFSISSRGIQPSFSASFNDFLREDINLGLRGNLDSILSISQPAGFIDLLWYSSVESLSNKAESISERMSRKAEVLKANIRDFPSLSIRTAEREFLSDFIPKQANFPKVVTLPEVLRVDDNLDKVGNAIDKPPFIKKNTMSIYSSQDNLGITYEPITSIEPLGSLHVYDIEVEGTHNFVAEGIVAHNTAIKDEGLRKKEKGKSRRGEGRKRFTNDDSREKMASSAINLGNIKLKMNGTGEWFEWKIMRKMKRFFSKKSVRVGSMLLLGLLGGEYADYKWNDARLLKNSAYVFTFALVGPKDASGIDSSIGGLLDESTSPSPNIFKIFLGLSPNTLPLSAYRPTSITDDSNVQYYNIENWSCIRGLDEKQPNGEPYWSTKLLQSLLLMKPGEIIPDGYKKASDYGQIQNKLITEVTLGMYLASFGKDEKGAYMMCL